MENKPTKISIKELYEIAPLLLPNNVKEITKNVAVSNNEISIKLLCALAPFIKSSTLNDMANKIEFADGDELVGIAPFLSCQALEKLAAKLVKTE